MTYCKTVTIDGVDVRLQFASKEDAESSDAKSDMEEVKKFIAYAKARHAKKR